MEYAIGALLAVATAALARWVGFDRDRSFYPVVTVVIASYYCLFAAMGSSGDALGVDAAVATLFAAAAIAGFRTSLWLVVAALAGHGAMDLVHRHLIANPGVPPWWPGFCSAFDITAAAGLALLIRLGGEPQPYPKRTHACDRSSSPPSR